MEIPTSLETLLDYIGQLPLREHEDIQKLGTSLSSLLKAKDKRDAQGRLTQAAKDARQTLRNPRLQTTHRSTKRRAVQTARDNQAGVFKEALATAVLEGLKAEQLQVELDRYATNVEDPEAAGRSREDHGETYPSRFLQPLFNALQDKKVAASSFQRAPFFIHDLVARIYAAAHEDPEMRNEHGLLAALAHAGVFELYRGQMSEVEASVLDTITAMPISQEVADLQLLFRTRFPDAEPVSTAFLKGCMRMRDLTESLSQGASEASQDAAGILYQNEAKVVAAVLGWGDEEMRAAQSVVRFIRERGSMTDVGADRVSFLVFQIQLMLERLQPEHGSANEWLPLFQDWITSFAEQMQPVLRSEVVFFALMYAAFDSSLAKVRMDELTSSTSFWHDLAENETSRRDALASGKKFKLTESGRAVTEDEEDYHFIQALPLTAETAMFDKIIPLGAEFPVLRVGEPRSFGGVEFDASVIEGLGASARDPEIVGEGDAGAGLINLNRIGADHQAEGFNSADANCDSDNGQQQEVIPKLDVLPMADSNRRQASRLLPFLDQNEDEWDD